MSHWVEVYNLTADRAVIRARWCQSYLCRLRGLTFRRSLPEGTGLLLVDDKESISGAAIHMWAVFFPLGVVWIDAAKWVVDYTLARPWRVYMPKAPARYVLEGPPSMLEAITEGDALEFIGDPKH